MIQIKINGQDAKIGKDTVISYNLANFDLTDPGNRKVNYTNAFELPVAGNSLIFGFLNTPNEVLDLVYDFFSVDIIVDGIHVIQSGKGRVTEVTPDTIKIAVTEKPDLIEEMKLTPLDSTFMSTYNTGGDTSDFIPTLLNATTGFKFDIIYNQFQIENGLTNNSFYQKWDKCNLTAYVKWIFETYETLKSVTFAGDLWTDSFFENLRIVVYHGVVRATVTDDIDIDNITLNNVKSFYDLFVNVLRLFGATFTVSGDAITLTKLDDLDWDTPVDWTGKLVELKKKNFFIPDTAQNNYIGYTPANNASKSLGRANIQSANLTLPFETDLIKIDGKVYPFIGTQNYLNTAGLQRAILIDDKDSFVNLASIFDFISWSDKSISDFIFIVDGTYQIDTGTDFNADYVRFTAPGYTVTKVNYAVLSGDNRYIATYYNPQNDYIRLGEILQIPIFIEAELFLPLMDVINFDRNNVVLIPELGGIFWVNSIKDYLLNSPKRTATVELIKIR